MTWWSTQTNPSLVTTHCTPDIWQTMLCMTVWQWCYNSDAWAISGLVSDTPGSVVSVCSNRPWFPSRAFPSPLVRLTCARLLRVRASRTSWNELQRWYLISSKLRVTVYYKPRLHINFVSLIWEGTSHLNLRGICLWHCWSSLHNWSWPQTPPPGCCCPPSRCRSCPAQSPPPCRRVCPTPAIKRFIHLIVWNVNLEGRGRIIKSKWTNLVTEPRNKWILGKQSSNFGECHNFI